MEGLSLEFDFPEAVNAEGSNAEVVARRDRFENGNTCDDF